MSKPNPIVGIKSSYPATQQPLRKDELAELCGAIEGHLKENPELTIGEFVFSVFSQFIIVPRYQVSKTGSSNE